MTTPCTVRPAALLLPCLILPLVIGCQQADRGQAEDPSSTATGWAAADAYVVNITAANYAFQAPDEIPSGWITFRMNNEGEETHFLLLVRLPADKTFVDYERAVIPAYDSAMNALTKDGASTAEARKILDRLVPDWVSSVSFLGGPGLTAPGRTAQTTVKLDPGTYVMECYVKTPDGRLHSSLGMLRPITVTSQSSEASAPPADLEITLLSAEMATEREVTPGKHTFAVHFTELASPDVHLVRLENRTDVNELVGWMDGFHVDGLRAPAPAEFLGGAMYMPAGHTAYVAVDLTPGSYAWIAGWPTDKGMVEKFTVESR